MRGVTGGGNVALDGRAGGGKAPEPPLEGKRGGGLVGKRGAPAVAGGGTDRVCGAGRLCGTVRGAGSNEGSSSITAVRSAVSRWVFGTMSIAGRAGRPAAGRGGCVGEGGVVLVGAAGTEAPERSITRVASSSSSSIGLGIRDGGRTDGPALAPGRGGAGRTAGGFGVPIGRSCGRLKLGGAADGIGRGGPGGRLDPPPGGLFVVIALAW